jgi:hypothetical protein
LRRALPSVESSGVLKPVSERRRLPPDEHAGFIRVGEGESLSDVAARLYGTRARSQTLWLANRDLIADQNVPLPPGTLLRTP